MDEIAALLEPHIPALRRYAWALLRDGDAADDLVQDCLERALARWRLRRRDGNLRAWLFTIQRNLFLSGLRRGRRRGPDVDIDALAAVPSAEASQDSELMRRDVLAELDALSEEQRSVLLLVAVEDFSYAEAARILGVPLGTVMSRLSRARGDAPASGLRLRRGLEEGQVTGDRPIGEDDLHAFVEGRLPPERREAVETFLADHPAAAAQVAADRERREALRARLAFKADEPIPARLRIAHVRAERRSVQGRRLAAIAAALAWLVVGGATGWTAHAWMARPIAANQSRVAQDALSAHRVFVAEIAHPVEVGAAQQAHLLQWLSKRLGRSLQAPDLAALGYHLMGGRLLPAGNEPAAQLMYEDDRGARLTLYIRASDSGETSFRFAQSGEVSAFSWIDGGLGYAISAALDRERLLRIAEAVYRQLDHAPSPESKRL